MSDSGRMSGMRKRSLLIGIAVVAIAVGAVSLFTPFLGRARFGPMRGFAMGPMGVGMMRDYSGLSGDELDIAFLQDMIPHHMSAVMMSEQLLSRVDVEHSQLEELAASIRTIQTQEIRRMSLWMDRWFN